MLACSSACRLSSMSNAASEAKTAVTVVSPFIVTVQNRVVAHPPPPHPSNRSPVYGTASSVTCAPAGNVNAQSKVQANGEPLAVTLLRVIEPLSSPDLTLRSSVSAPAAPAVPIVTFAALPRPTQNAGVAHETESGAA